MWQKKGRKKDKKEVREEENKESSYLFHNKLRINFIQMFGLSVKYSHAEARN